MVKSNLKISKYQNATEPEEPPEETESTEPKEESGWLSKMGTDKADKRNES